MDGSDDYFFGDDIVFDEQTIAALDQQEQKWAVTQGKQPQQPGPAQQEISAGQRRPISQEAPLPSRKRRKTSHGATSDGAVAFAHRTVGGEDLDEDLPDISIIGDGSYKFPVTQHAEANNEPSQVRGSSSSSNVNGASTSARPLPHITHAVPVPRAAPLPVRYPPPVRPPERNPSSAGVRVAQTPGATQGPSGGARPPRNRLSRGATLAAIEAALKDFVPPPTTAALAPTQGHPARPARGSPAPGPSRVPSGGSQRPRGSNAPPGRLHGRRGSPAPLPASRVPSGASSSVSPPVHRRQSVGREPLQRVSSSPSIPSQRPLQAQQQQQDHIPQLQQVSSEQVPRSEFDALKAQFDEVLKSLEDAQNVRYTKEGEVTILRKSIEKTAKDHAAEVSRIKVAKEQAEAAQAQTRKEMYEEVERVKTLYMFKQHELETRKTPWSVRIRRTDHQGPLTPVSTSTQRRQAAVDGQGDGGFQTPSRSRMRHEMPDSPGRQRRKKIVDVADSPPKKMAKLPGFFNAFEPSTPKDTTPKSRLRFGLSQPSPAPQSRKGKERQVVFDDGPQMEDLFFNPPPESDVPGPQSQPTSSPTEEAREEAPAPELEVHGQSSQAGPSSIAEPTSSANDDIDMKGDAEQVQPPEPVEPLFEPDWIGELYRIVLTHRHHAAKQPTLQLLMNHAMPESASAERTQKYSTHSAKLLENLGTASRKVSDIEETIQAIQEALCEMGQALCGLQSMLHLAALLDMLKILALFLPMFVPLSLTPTGVKGSGDAPPKVLALLCDVVRGHLDPGVTALDDHRDSLAREGLGLLEAICWNAPPDLSIRLSVVIRKSRVLSTLLSLRQPVWLLQRSFRVLTLIASYPALHKQFLSFPIPDDPDEVVEKDYSAIPHIEKMADLLVRSTEGEPECRALKDSILYFITTLAIGQGDSLAILLQSKTLIPAIVVFLTNITDPVWAEHEELMESPELADWTVQTMMRVVVLLFHMFTGTGISATKLREKLMTAPKRIYSGLWHMFTVTLGRISYAPPPDAFSPENQVKLEQICDLAKDVLELVVDGPELESIWAAFHVEEDVPSPKTQNDEEEGESEAHMLHSDVE